MKSPKARGIPLPTGVPVNTARFGELSKHRRRDHVTQLRNHTDLILVSQEIPNRVSGGNCQANRRFIYEVAVFFTSSVVFSFPSLATLLGTANIAFP